MAASVRVVALLRAVNVGGRTVKMADLRAQFAALGLAGVETFIASGNVIFSSAPRSMPALEKKIAKHLKSAFGFEVPVFLRTAAEMTAVATYEPFPGAEGGTLYVGFLPAPPGRDESRKVLAFGGPHEALHVHGREVYFLITGPVIDAAMFRAPIEKTVGMPMTVRNVTTVRKLAAKMSS